jgi:hypothetical protein
MQRSNLKMIEVPYLEADHQPTDNPEEASIWRTIHDPVQIEEKLLARKIAHFGQAEGTIFTTKRLQSLFGYSGTTPTAEAFQHKKNFHH